MRLFTLIAVALAAFLLSGSAAMAQGSAIGGVLNTADKLQQDVQESQKPLRTGPSDSLEKVSPGKIDPGASKVFKETPSGLRYRILRKSSKAKPKASDTVVAHYKGWLDNNKIFDSSYRRGEPTAFPLSGVIRGWTEGLQLIGEGGMIELEIPHELGYGVRGMSRGGIPPRARLHFLVELKSVK